VIRPLALLGCALIPAARASADPHPDNSETATVIAPSAPATSAVTEAPVKPVAPKPAAITLNADINLTTQQLTVTSGGKVLHVWPISSGRVGFETPRGTFRPQWAAKMHFSKKYDDAPMPHSVFFNGGVATHATQATHLLGRPASHGCVRLSPSAASTFYALVHKHGYHSTRIAVHGSPKVRDEAVASRRHRDDGPQRVAQRRLPPQAYATGYGYVPSQYGYAPSYGYQQPRRVYVMPYPGDPQPYGQVRYMPRGYVRY
jgi:lipoprotein-anchoring transpeptidase ErfK/SrfK